MSHQATSENYCLRQSFPQFQRFCFAARHNLNKTENHTLTLGIKSFQYSGLKIWNLQPVNLRNPN